jgi:hypothetical protein
MKDNHPNGYAIDDTEIEWKAADESTRIILFKLEDDAHKKVMKWRKKLYMLEANANYKVNPTPAWEALSFFIDRDAAVNAAAELSKDMFQLSIKYMLMEKQKAILN